MKISDLFESKSLFELRRNPEQNPKVSTLEALEKYAGRKDVFVSFTSDVGILSQKGGNKPTTGWAQSGLRAKGADRNVSGSKLGINPKSEYDTPIGIYTYPIDYVLKEEGRVEFAANAPFLYVVQATKPILDIANYSEADFEKDSEKLLKGHARWSADSTKRVAIRDAKLKIPAAWLWNWTRLTAENMAEDINSQYSEDDYYSEYLEEPERPDEVDFEDDDEYESAMRDYEREYAEYEEKRDRFEPQEDPKKYATAPVQWSKILRSLGYSGVADFDGNGLIHDNEPTQAVFFSKDALKVLEVIGNKRSTETPKSQFEIWSGRPDIFANMMRNGKIPMDQALKYFNGLMATRPFVDEKIGLAFEQLTFEQLPEDLQAYLKAHPESVDQEFALRVIPLTDRKIIKIISENTNLVGIAPMRPAVLKYVIENIKMFRGEIGSLLKYLSVDIIVDLITEDPSIAEKIMYYGNRSLLTNPKIQSVFPLDAYFSLTRNYENTLDPSVAIQNYKKLKAKYPNDVMSWLHSLQINQPTVIIPVWKSMNKEDATSFIESLGWKGYLDKTGPSQVYSSLSQQSEFIKSLVKARPEFKEMFKK